MPARNRKSTSMSKNDYAYVDGVGLFQTRESAMIYDYILNNHQDGATPALEWTRLRDAMFGELAFMDHDDYVLFEIEILRPVLKEIHKRTGEKVRIEDCGHGPEGDEQIRFVRHIED